MIKNTRYKNPQEILRLRRHSHAIGVLLSLSTLVLLAAGALVTSTGSSLAVPDWPLAYGELFPPMVGGILYEHGHRLIASLVGLMTVVFSGWLWWAEDRIWVKWLGVGALALVIFQGIMGGVTVLYLLPKAVSVTHALLAQLFFLLTIGLAQVTAPAWLDFVEKGHRNSERRLGRVGTWAVLSLGVYVVTLLLGATMRHNNAGLAIPDFPLAYGGLIPPLSSFPLIIHFAHRISAIVLVVMVVGTAVMTLREYRGVSTLTKPAWIILTLVVVQFLLGGTIIWTKLAVFATTLHLVNGALLFGATGMLLIRIMALRGLVIKLGK